MPNSLKCKIKHLCYNGTLTERERDRILKALEQECCRNMEEIKEIMECDADIETKYKMISNILTAKPHYFEKQEPLKDMEVSDGYHTFNQLYHQRAVLFATIVNQNKDIAWKSFKHSDGKYCFDSNGEWFIVGIDTPKGSYTYHYSKEYWDMFNCKELECAKEWDGHTEEDVTRLLSLEMVDKHHEIECDCEWDCIDCPYPRTDCPHNDKEVDEWFKQKEQQIAEELKNE